MKTLLEGMDGVASAVVDHPNGAATVTVQPGAQFDDAKAKELLDKDMFTLQSCEKQSVATN